MSVCCDLACWPKLDHTIIDYTLTPQSRYPSTLDEVHTVYKWVARGGLGFKPTSIAVFGESAGRRMEVNSTISKRWLGGNMVAAMCLRLIRDNHPQQPCGMLLNFPALNLHLSPSPSRFLHQNDPILPRGLLEMALDAYYPAHSEITSRIPDPYVSPGVAPDDMLSQFPPTTIVVGDLDPLLDDSVDFDTRLRRLNIPGRLHVLPGLTHGFLICNAFVSAAQDAIDQSGQILLQLLRDHHYRSSR